MLRWLAIAISLRISNRGYTRPERRQLGFAPRLPALSQFMRQGVAKLSLPQHSTRIEGQRITGCDVLSQPTCHASSAANESHWCTRPPEHDIHRVCKRACRELA